MNKELLNALLEENMNEVVAEMIGDSRNFLGGSIPYDFSEMKSKQEDAINYEECLIKTDVWMNNTLEQDDFSKNINRLIYLVTEIEGNMFDYEIIEYLEKELKMEFDEVENGYTYNSPDYCHLDRDIHYSLFKFDGECYAIFSVHYGADARAGFGWNSCFKIDEDYFFHSMTIDCYDSKTDKDYSIWQLEDIAEYNKEDETWYHKESGNEISLNSSANGW